MSAGNLLFPTIPSYCAISKWKYFIRKCSSPEDLIYHTQIIIKDGSSRINNQTFPGQKVLTKIKSNIWKLPRMSSARENYFHLPEKKESSRDKIKSFVKLFWYFCHPSMWRCDDDYSKEISSWFSFFFRGWKLKTTTHSWIVKCARQLTINEAI